MHDFILTKTLYIFAATGDICDPADGGVFFGFPTWHQYLSGVTEDGGQCAVRLAGLSDVWLILLAIVEILLRLAAIAAIVFIIYAGIRYITARGNPDKITSARVSIQDALIGLVITIIAIALVSYFGGRIS